jgi:hypothetical protein
MPRSIWMLTSSLLKTNPSSKIRKRRKSATKNINLLNLKGVFPKNQYHVKVGVETKTQSCLWDLEIQSNSSSSQEI